MKYVLPTNLTKGDTIGVIAPSGPICDKEPIIRAKEYFEELGYNVILGEHAFSKDRYLAASDKDRLSDLHWAFQNKNINTIICARGGYGALRLINNIDYELVKRNPKNFCGYSDITVLSLMFLKHSNLITFSSPMMKGDFGVKNKSQFTIDNFFNAINNQNIEITGKSVLEGKTTKGILWGGNLSSIVSLCGIDFIPDENFIFFAEDLNEPVYKIDKMLTQLTNIPNFKKNIKGIVLGKFLDSGYPEQLEQLFKEIATELNIPTIYDVKISHETDKITIPIGKMGILENNTLKI